MSSSSTLLSRNHRHANRYPEEGETGAFAIRGVDGDSQSIRNDLCDDVTAASANNSTRGLHEQDSAAQPPPVPGQGRGGGRAAARTSRQEQVPPAPQQQQSGDDDHDEPIELEAEPVDEQAEAAQRQLVQEQAAELERLRREREEERLERIQERRRMLDIEEQLLRQRLATASVERVGLQTVDATTTTTNNNNSIVPELQPTPQQQQPEVVSPIAAEIIDDDYDYDYDDGVGGGGGGGDETGSSSDNKRRRLLLQATLCLVLFLAIGGGAAVATVMTDRSSVGEDGTISDDNPDLPTPSISPPTTTSTTTTNTAAPVTVPPVAATTTARPTTTALGKNPTKKPLPPGTSAPPKPPTSGPTTPSPSKPPTARPTVSPTTQPTVRPTGRPTAAPSPKPSSTPRPTPAPSGQPASLAVALPPAVRPPATTVRPDILRWKQLGLDLQGQANDWFGGSVALSADGNILAVGASSADQVRLFRYDDSADQGWAQLGADLQGRVDAVALSANGTILAVGADWHDSGQVRVFRYDDGTTNTNTGEWTQLGDDLVGQDAGDRFGNSVALSADGTILAAGAFSNNGNTGHVRVFRYDDSTGDSVTSAWTQLGADLQGRAAWDFFGRSVALSTDGTILAVSAYGIDGKSQNGGHVRVFRYDDSAANAATSAGWTQLGDDLVGQDAGDRFGGSVALSADGTILAVGAIRNNDNGLDAAYVRVFRYDDGAAINEADAGTWTQLGDDLNGEGTIDWFRQLVALSADGLILAVGASGIDGIYYYPGHVRVFRYRDSAANAATSAGWTQLGDDFVGQGAGDRFGSSVALSANGTILAVGVPGNDGNGRRAGLVRVFQGLTVEDIV